MKQLNNETIHFFYYMSKKHLILIFSTAIISGVSIFLNSYAVQLANPTQYTFVRNLLIVLLISACLLWGRVRSQFKHIDGKQWALLALVGILGGGVAFILFFKGLAITPGPVGSFLHKTLFIWVALLAPIFLRERIRPLFLVPAVALLWGNFLFLGVKMQFWSWGMVMILAAAIIWAIENVISKHLLNQGVKPFVIIWSRMTFGAGLIFIYLLAGAGLPSVGQISLNLFFWLMVSAVLLIGYMSTWYVGLSRVPVTLASTILLLGSPVTLIFNWMFVGKTLIADQILGIVLIVAGTIFAVYLFIDIAKQLNTKYDTTPIR
ncbi:MAG: hypothetical protein A2445_00110 [Candidatus Jacksonbacteria bacterium RIFOXYC2_FULL_44_29]|nr:MAG: hypothetical protein UW45_C0066G0010 [Parcubacteria group bacterium GW2011_GWC2_44_22]OGY75711.1 MAG: hypothetical protein A2240_06190 [Candidatus Jacksonbacteria bacterium RIFOXYA2_FULL_43_12]OGY78110.1 MAG: hypothetical protein A2445_00110 [Candidatus Jacksonbacteria bacterium RIFOXYC2_FULL_44_29]OGY81077.1 MAG: hypothetical protein A2550_02590 [Candidatus Jacksonbacteria bacterium RIFOXYD2_FULL_43_21]HBH46239.1 hypothetical protein [Candidatus Jacksonbacteria bacterium]